MGRGISCLEKGVMLYRINTKSTAYGTGTIRRTAPDSG